MQTNLFAFRVITIIYPIFVLLFGPLLAYIIYISVPFISDFVDFPRVTLRVVQLMALLVLIPIISKFCTNKTQIWGYTGFTEKGYRVTEFFRGAMMGFFSIGLLICALWITGIRELRPDLDVNTYFIVKLVLGALATGLLVALLEETWFRGGMQGLYSQAFTPLFGLLFVALLYMLLHFVRSPDVSPDYIVHWYSGYQELWNAFVRVSHRMVLQDALALLIVGLILGAVRYYQGNILLCMGMHAMWVILIKIFKKITVLNPDVELRSLVGPYNGMLGYLSSILLFAFLLLLVGYFRKLYASR